MKPPAFAPAYVGMYVILAEIAREHGYALAVHGTVARDFDLIAIPWTDAAGDANVLIEKLREAVGGLIIPSGTKGGRYDAARGEFVEAVIENPSLKPHGRLAWNIHIDEGSAVLDVSVMPRVNHSLEAELAAAKAEVERLLEEVEGVLSVMPPWSVIRSCEGGGHEDVAGSLALSVSCLVEHLRRRGA